MKLSNTEIMMDRAVTDDHGLEVARRGELGFRLPLVSIVIANYNYGRFLAEAVASALAQTYPNVELIIADDASTDDSGSVLVAIGAAHPDVKIIRRATNGGQSLTSRQGFEASAGEYVVFLDADDVLLPDFIETHVFVHLSLRIPVGLSSSDMAQSLGSRLVLSTIQPFSEYVQSGKGKRADLIRRVDENAPELWSLPAPAADIAERVHFVAPLWLDGWVWAPTSGNCFRRDALSMFFDNEALVGLRSCTDAYLIRGVTVLTGSVLIDRTLSVYRLHGVNVFSQMAHLNGLLSYDRQAPNDNDQKGRRLVVDHLIANATVFARRVHSPFHFLGALKALNDAWPRLPSRIAGCRSYVGGEIVTHFLQLSEAVGLWPLTAWASLMGIAPWTLMRAFATVLHHRARQSHKN
jgi:glycosyltransferase involved in cell wall biosynthesis